MGRPVSKRTCDVEGCGLKHCAYGFCNFHSDKYRRYGDPLHAGKDSKDARLWSYIDRRGPDECWPWTAALQAGYGRILYDGRRYITSNLVYRLTHGDIPHGHQVDHVCHNPQTCAGGSTCTHRRCCNPAHLQAVTPAANSGPHRSASPCAANARKTHCKRGHDLADARLERKGGRTCRACEAARRKRAHV